MLLPSGASTNDYSRLANARGWGAGWRACDAINGGLMAPVKAKRSGATIAGGVHRNIQQLCQLIIDEIERRGYMFVPGWNWGAECRQISGTNTPSNHSWGLALDLNAPNNPYTSSGQHDTPDWAYAIWRSYGFGLGADYQGKKDWMHVEAMGTPSDMAIMTALAVKNIGGGGSVTVPDPTPTPEKDWFDMATQADLEQSVYKIMTNPDVLKNLARSVSMEFAEMNDDAQKYPYAKAARDKIAENLVNFRIPSSVDGQSYPVYGFLAGTDARAQQTIAKLDQALAELARINGTTSAPVATYTVVAGDTLSGIAAKLGGTVDQWVATNKLANPSVIEIGQVLTVPR